MLKITDLSYCYRGRDNNTLNNLSLSLEEGEMLLLAGKSGCGKSTLLKAISGVLKINDEPTCANGSICIAGKDINGMSLENIGLMVGTVYQSPEDQLFAMTVEDEVGFALENRGVDADIIQSTIRATLQKVGLSGFEKQSIHCLSGGQKQRLAVASVLVTKPKLLILDEPVSQMNPQGVKDFMNMLCELNKKEKITIIIAEHRVNELTKYFKRLAIMSNGRLVYDGDIEGAWNQISRHQFAGLREPQTIKLARALQLSKLEYVTEKVVSVIKQECVIKNFCQDKVSKQMEKKEILLAASNIKYKYQGAKQFTLDNISLHINKGEIISLMGVNGAGKSTLLNILAGLNEATEGFIKRAKVDGSLAQFSGYLRQEPDLMLLADTVWLEMLWQNKKVDEEYIIKLLEKLQLLEYKGDFPLALSKGQRLRTILGALLARKPQLLILDEPTAGQDQESLEEIKSLIDFFVKQGGSVLFCTHDIELASEIADRILVMHEGKLIADDVVNVVLSNKKLLKMAGLSEPPMLKVSELLTLPPCIKIEEVLSCVDASIVGRKRCSSMGQGN